MKSDPPPRKPPGQELTGTLPQLLLPTLLAQAFAQLPDSDESRFLGLYNLGPFQGRHTLHPQCSLELRHALTRERFPLCVFPAADLVAVTAHALAALAAERKHHGSRQLRFFSATAFSAIA